MDSVGWTAAGAVVSYAVALLPATPRPLAIVAGTIVCFVGTGLGLASAILPRRHNVTVWATTVVACAVAVGIFGGLLLEFIPSGLVRLNWLTYALAVTLAGCTIAHFRGVGRPVRWGRVGVGRPGWAPVVMLTAAAAMVIGAGFISANSFNSHEQPFTELWLVPNNPTRSPLRAVHAELGVRSHESATENFTVVMDTGARTVTSQVTLAPGQVWTLPVVAEGAEARASLYRGKVAGEPYRTVWIATR
jgi:hypothetical protein